LNFLDIEKTTNRNKHMPIVAIDLTREEAEIIDIIAHKEKRARRAQAHIMLAEAIKCAEAKLEAEKEAP
jgi:hypothetical protein